MAQCLRSVSTKFLSTSYLGNGGSVLSKNFDVIHIGSSGILSPGLCTLAQATKPTNYTLNFPTLPSSYREREDRQCNTLDISKITSVHIQSSPAVVFAPDFHPLLFAASPAAPVPKPEAEPNDFVPPNTQDEGKSQTDSDGDRKPSSDQLKRVSDVLEKTLPNIFVSIMDYKIFHGDVTLVDNIRGRTYQGLNQLIKQIALLRIVGHFKYAFVTVELVSLHQVPTEGRITTRCRIKGISGLRVMLRFWQYKLWKYREIMKQVETWHDLIIHFDVDASSGLVYRITLDKVIEDKDQLLDDRKDKKLRLAAKLAAASGAFASPIFVGALDNTIITAM